MKQNIQLSMSRDYYLNVELGNSLVQTEQIYWNYHYYLGSLKEYNIPINERLRKSMIIKRKKYLEEKINK